MIGNGDKSAIRRNILELPGGGATSNLIRSWTKILSI